mmetsp:Transcript_31523/g.68139  ORF Transcript_31523/g.68139 Transcript_31523/m.68139 type:complete len:389 (+) Transcript_31523:940-2106(+)
MVHLGVQTCLGVGNGRHGLEGGDVVCALELGDHAVHDEAPDLGPATCLVGRFLGLVKPLNLGFTGLLLLRLPPRVDDLAGGAHGGEPVAVVATGPLEHEGEEEGRGEDEDGAEDAGDERLGDGQLGVGPGKHGVGHPGRHDVAEENGDELRSAEGRVGTGEDDGGYDVLLDQVGRRDLLCVGLLGLAHSRDELVVLQAVDVQDRVAHEVVELLVVLGTTPEHENDVGDNEETEGDDDDNLRRREVLEGGGVAPEVGDVGLHLRLLLQRGEVGEMETMALHARDDVVGLGDVAHHAPLAAPRLQPVVPVLARLHLPTRCAAHRSALRRGNGHADLDGLVRVVDGNGISVAVADGHADDGGGERGAAVLLVGVGVDGHGVARGAHVHRTS